MTSLARSASYSRVNRRSRFTSDVKGSRGCRCQIGPRRTYLCGSQASGYRFNLLQLNLTLLIMVWLIGKYLSHHLLDRVVPDLALLVKQDVKNLGKSAGKILFFDVTTGANEE